MSGRKMITNTYELNRQPTAQEILDSDYCSFWLKKRLMETLDIDLLDAIRDVEVLHAILIDRLRICESGDWKDLCVNSSSVLIPTIKRKV